MCISVFYEVFRWIVLIVSDIVRVLGNRYIVIVKEISKMFEIYVSGIVDDVMVYLYVDVVY